MASRRNDNKKPQSDRQKERKKRPCLMCAKDFVSEHFGQRAEFAAGPRDVLFGGIISAVMDCHSIWTAIAGAYKQEEREIGMGDVIWYVTGSLHVSYRKPTPLDVPLTLTARVAEMHERKAIVTCSLTSGGEERATGEMVAVRVPETWFGSHTR